MVEITGPPKQSRERDAWPTLGWIIIREPLQRERAFPDLGFDSSTEKEACETDIRKQSSEQAQVVEPLSKGECIPGPFVSKRGFAALECDVGERLPDGRHQPRVVAHLAFCLEDQPGSRVEPILPVAHSRQPPQSVGARWSWP